MALALEQYTHFTLPRQVQTFHVQDRERIACPLEMKAYLVKFDKHLDEMMNIQAIAAMC